jgi:hypothetical protein
MKLYVYSIMIKEITLEILNFKKININAMSLNLKCNYASIHMWNWLKNYCINFYYDQIKY